MDQEDIGYLDTFLAQDEESSSDESSYNVSAYHLSSYIDETPDVTSRCFNMLHMEDNKHMAIMDGGADTCVIRKGWKIIDRHPTRRANVVGFDTTSRKNNLHIVSAVTSVDLPDNKVVFLG